MLTVTSEAKGLLADALNQMQDAQDDECFRLGRGGDGKIALVTGLPTQEDEAVTHNDRTVLVVEKDLADGLDGKTLDVQDKGEGKKALVLV